MYLHFRTSIDRLYAAGEYTQVFTVKIGWRRSMLESLIYGRRAAPDINSRSGMGDAPGRPLHFKANGPPLPTGMLYLIYNIK